MSSKLLKELQPFDILYVLKDNSVGLCRVISNDTENHKLKVEYENNFNETYEYRDDKTIARLYDYDGGIMSHTLTTCNDRCISTDIQLIKKELLDTKDILDRTLIKVMFSIDTLMNCLDKDKFTESLIHHKEYDQYLKNCDDCSYFCTACNPHYRRYTFDEWMKNCRSQLPVEFNGTEDKVNGVKL